jgi:hypothetical protein
MSSPITAMPTMRRRRNLRLPFDWRWLPVAAVVIVVVAVMIPALQSGNFVEHVSVKNPSEFDVEVAVAGPTADGWTDLGTAVNHRTSVADEVYDQGKVWTFDFRTPTQDVQTQMTRDQLAEAGWTVAVPPELIAQLRAAHAPVSPAVSS